MPRNGSGSFSRSNGVFTGATVWASDRDAGTKITAAHHDSHDQDIATALTGSLAANGETPVTANLPMGAFKHTNVGNAAARNQYAAAGQIQDGSLVWGGTTGGSATAYTISLSPAITAYALGQTFAFIPHATNTGASPTMNVNGLGAVTMVGGDGTTGIRRGALVIGRIYVAAYDSAAGGKIHVLSPSGGAGGPWVTYAPTVSKTGGGTFTVGGSPVYTFRTDYPKIEFKIDFHGTVVGAITAVSLTLPTGITIPTINHYNAVILDWAGGFAVGKCVISDTAITISEYNATAFPAGTCGLHTAIVQAALG